MLLRSRWGPHKHTGKSIRVKNSPHLHTKGIMWSLLRSFDKKQLRTDALENNYFIIFILTNYWSTFYYLTVVGTYEILITKIIKISAIAKIYEVIANVIVKYNDNKLI